MSDFVFTETSDSFSLDDNGDGFSVFPGAKGEKGDPGEGVPTGGTTGQVLTKKTDEDYDTEWADPSAEIEVDSALSTTSENPVQNKVITAALNEKAAIIEDTASGAIASFPDGADGLPMQSVVCNIEPVQEGSGDPSPDNIRPISGHEGLTAQRMGVNVWNEEWENGDISAATGEPTPNSSIIRSKNFIPVTPGKQYYFKIGEAGTALTIRTRWYGRNHEFLGTTPTIRYNDIFTVPDNAYYLKFTPQVAYGATYNNDISINYPSTDHDYHAYSGTTLPFSWQSEAGTVYGGNLTINEDGSCVLTVDRAAVDLGDLTWAYTTGDSYAGSPYFASGNVAGKKAGSNNMICSQYAVGVNRGSIQDCVITPWNSTNALSLACRNDRFTDAATFKTAMSGVQLVYELATPQTYTLPSVTMLSTLLGTNNIWTDVGDTAVEYRADTKQFILKKIAELNA